MKNAITTPAQAFHAVMKMVVQTLGKAGTVPTAKDHTKALAAIEDELHALGCEKVSRVLRKAVAVRNRADFKSEIALLSSTIQDLLTNAQQAEINRTRRPLLVCDLAALFVQDELEAAKADQELAEIEAAKEAQQEEPAPELDTQTTGRVYGYARASTDEQDAQRGEAEILDTASQYSRQVVKVFTENHTGTQADRPELANLLDVAQRGDVILVESMDRLTRLSEDAYNGLMARLTTDGIKLVVCDMPNTHTNLSEDAQGDWEANIITRLVMDMAAAHSRKWWENMKKRQAQGIQREQEADKARPQEERKYQGRKTNADRNQFILDMLLAGKSPSEIARFKPDGKTKLCSRAQVYLVKNQAKADGLLK